MQSRLYVGEVRHRRMEPVEHAFTYRMFQLFLDLDELDDVFRGRWLWSTRRFNVAWFRRADYLAPGELPLKDAVVRRVEEQTGFRPAGPVRVLTHLRYLGFAMDPVSFYYCYDESGEQVEAIVAEITNTPWKERHAYVLRRPHGTRPGGVQRFRFAKVFHVSPFIDMDVSYDWRFGEPGERLSVHMEDLRDGQPFFDATLALERREIGATSLAGALARHPLMTAEVAFGIYWQALRLRLKGVPAYDHPGTSPIRAGGTP